MIPLTSKCDWDKDRRTLCFTSLVDDFVEGSSDVYIANYLLSTPGDGVISPHKDHSPASQVLYPVALTLSWWLDFPLGSGCSQCWRHSSKHMAVGEASSCVCLLSLRAPLTKRVYLNSPWRRWGTVQSVVKVCLQSSCWECLEIDPGTMKERHCICISRGCVMKRRISELRCSPSSVVLPSSSF